MVTIKATTTSCTGAHSFHFGKIIFNTNRIIFRINVVLTFSQAGIIYHYTIRKTLDKQFCYKNLRIEHKIEKNAKCGI
jgi:hypothetical protein